MSAGPHVMGQGDGVLSGAALRVAEARVDLDRMATLLDDRIQGLSGQWVGAGGAAFLRLHAQWSETRREITGALTEFEAALRGTEHDNHATDDDRAAELSGLSRRLG